MNWKIKEFTFRAMSMRKELALLVKHGGAWTSALPGVSAFNLHAHPTHCCWRPAGSTQNFTLRLMWLEISKTSHNPNPHTLPWPCWGAGKEYSRRKICCFVFNPPAYKQGFTQKSRWPYMHHVVELWEWAHSNFRPWWENITECIFNSPHLTRPLVLPCWKVNKKT